MAAPPKRFAPAPPAGPVVPPNKADEGLLSLTPAPKRAPPIEGLASGFLSAAVVAPNKAPPPLLRF